jgi:hydroxypyruvate isomerase
MSEQQQGPSRREVMKYAAAGAVATMIGGKIMAETESATPPRVAVNGRIRHSVCRWCYSKMSLDDLAQNAKAMGLVGIDLLQPGEFDTVKKYGLICTMTMSHSIPKGLNRKENWDECLGAIRRSLDATAAEGWARVICFSGNRAGMDDDEGMKNCAEAVKQVVGDFEKKNVVLCMELLNSKRNHHDYMCDKSKWGVELCKSVGSDNFKLLYDIYHMQIDEGDVIATIRENHPYFAHYHTGGVPGRNEIDETQELYYPAIMRAIVDTGYKGIVAQEFIPKRDPMTSLAQAIKICDV